MVVCPFKPTCIWLVLQQNNSFFFILELYFRGVVASVWCCLYLLISKRLIKAITLPHEILQGIHADFKSISALIKMPDKEQVLIPIFGIKNCPLWAKRICILANSKMCCLHRKTSFAAHNLLLFQRGFSSPKSGKIKPA